MPSRPFFSLAAALLLLPPLDAQPPSAPHAVAVEAGQSLVARRGAEFQLPLKVIIRSGHHINSNAPAEDYLIPTALTWEPGPLTNRGVTYPKAETVQYEFSPKPLLVYSGTATLVSRFVVPSGAPRGPATLSGKLRYQACTDKMCLAPRTLPVSVPVAIE